MGLVSGDRARRCPGRFTVSETKRAVIAFIMLDTFKGMYINWLWFQGVGFQSVYEKMIRTQVLLFLIGGGIFSAFFGVNIYIAGRLINEPDAMTAWIRDPRHVRSPTAMPALGVGEQEGRDIAAYLYTLK